MSISMQWENMSTDDWKSLGQRGFMKSEWEMMMPSMVSTTEFISKHLMF